LQQQRVEEIVAAATACFLEKGFHKTSVQDIAARAGLSMGLLYRYFPGKEAIIEAAATTAGREAREHIERFAQERDVRAGFRQLARALLEVAAIPGYQALLAEVHAESFRSPALRRLEQEDVSAMRGAMAAALKQHQRAGRLLKSVDVSALATALLAAVEGLAALSGLQAQADALPQRAVDALADLLSAAQPSPPPRRRTQAAA
jgi:AcrR family transcriptional regulator